MRRPASAPNGDLRRFLAAEIDTAIRDLLPQIDLQEAIPAAMTFRQWCQSLTVERTDSQGNRRPPLKVDGKPFTLDDRPAMAWIYDQIPTTREQAFRTMLILRKCAQVGFTVMEMLATIYLALKFEPLKIGMFLPAMKLAQTKSAERFMPIVRTVPEAHSMMPKNEGNVLLRRMGESLFHFLWTSGKATTESNPMDVVTFDEVQEMQIADMEKVGERLSASDFKFTLMGSTANWPDADIDYWYNKGSQHRFHTRCSECGAEEPLDDYFPQCIRFDEAFPDRVTGVPGDFRYVCRDGHWIDDPQQGEWKPDNPDAVRKKIISIHFHQMLSPTISPREMYEAYINADDIKNFFNRKLGKPYQDPSQIPVTLAHLNACAEAGMALGLTWKKRARGTFMGIDQMGAFNVAIIKERLPDGRQAVVHCEAIHDADPFARCDELMRDYGVQVCVVEQLPNFNDALRFTNRHPGRVFLCSGYGAMENGYIAWGDAPKLDASERRTAEQDRTRYTVRLDQFKAMEVSLKRIVNTQCLFPDPQALVQDVREKESTTRKAILKDVAFVHFQKTALVTERVNEGERKLRRRVVKVAIDPHFSFANMLCDVAYARAYGTATFILPAIEDAEPTFRPVADAAPSAVAAQVANLMPVPKGVVCGACQHYPMGDDGPPANAHCPVYGAQTDAGLPGCEEFVPGARFRRRRINLV